MKKTARIITAALLILTMTMATLLLASCTPPKKIEDSLSNYLTEKYGDLHFTINDITQNTTTNGWYVVKASCKDTNTDFVMYASTVRTTDSYSVNYTNAKMAEKIINGPMAEYKDNVKSVQWMSDYEDGYENYTFRTVDLSKEYELSDVSQLYKVELQNVEKINDVSSLIYNTIQNFESSGTFLEKTTFVFEIDSYLCTVIADYSSTSNNTEGVFIVNIGEKFEDAKQNNFLNIINIDVSEQKETK